MAGRSGPGRAIARPAAAGTESVGDAVPRVVERVVYRDGDVDGAVDVAIVYEIPDAVSKLAFWIERPTVSVVATDGFDRSDVGGYTWQGSVDGPAFEWDGSGDRATVICRQPLTADDPSTYGAGTDDWALCLRPRTHTRWRYRGTEPRIDRRAAVRGVGIAGEQFVCLGEHAIAKRRVDAETVRLVVPAAATPSTAPDRILDSLAAASEHLDVGGRSDLVTVFVAPTDGACWAHRGLSLGPDARVNDDAALAAPTNIWVHEYVHTRQDRTATTAATEWLLEATAEYYALTQAFERGAIDFPTYRQVLERGVGEDSPEVVLADPSTWADDAQYRTGALVVAALDRRIRAASGGETTFQAVLRTWNAAAPAPFDATAFADAVERAGGPAARAAAIAYTETPTTPRPWSASTHAATFDVSPADCEAAGSPLDADQSGWTTADRVGDVAIDRAAPRHR
ncbi:PGF-CTERM archaeal protein-sorting signal [Salinarchaeum sp. Harcht-Bsk1]|uniref:PGF-CTERM protein-sorting signal n=1 Tax=Salinarchaeum sp. Harcht-Bsk1 TaxID=1333523 RepID=UPI00034236D3|nr:PGF-CTERM protein-sorting signal [Salinarchaeum sp. Harcht-Bsk1]AGN01401.1 PGF-CTERM archaeal protein-sorting signal [Salinarchaeum sp. Harcht-Bsk1]